MNMIIFYGSTIIEVYSDLVKFAQKQFSIQADITWAPVLILFAFYGLMGILTAFIGIRLGRKLLLQKDFSSTRSTSKKNIPIPQSEISFHYSIIWLILNLMLLITGFCLLAFTNWYIWSFSIIAISILWLIRYKRALRQLFKPKFWFGFLFITMLTAFVFNTMRSLPFLHGVMIGIEMNFRAILIILGFSVLGTELYNPVIRAFFLKTSFRQLPMALEVSFDSLPSMIASIPEVKVFLKNPTGVIFEVLSGIENRLEEIKQGLSSSFIFITGEIGEGKTTQVKKLIDVLRSESIPIAGIYSHRVVQNEERIGYDVVDIATLQETPFLRICSDTSDKVIGRYKILQDGLQAGLESLNRSYQLHPSVIIIDEVGQLELRDRGWAPALERLFAQRHRTFLLVVRDSFIEAFISKWKVKNYMVVKLSEFDVQTVKNAILNTLSLHYISK